MRAFVTATVAATLLAGENIRYLMAGGVEMADLEQELASIS
ncbi:MAG: hypothetical protein OXF74_11295 [Rhodobacteraceae bacterium]|nr:hypothetical protein [Paracoccaceae bacterium]